MSRRYQDRERLAALLAPPAPPCFADRPMWLTYVQSAAAEQRPGHTPGPLVLIKGEPASFNPRFDICADCTPSHEAVKHAAGKCKPTYLLTVPLTPARKKAPA